MRLLCALPAWLAGLLLLAAAGLKAHQAIVYPVPEPGLLEQPWLLAVQMPVEFGLGLLLLAGAWLRWTRRLTLAAFIGFAAVTAWKGFTDQASCGCFGVVEVHPWLTLAIDLAVVVGLVLAELGTRKAPASRPAGRRTLVILAAVWLLFAVPTAVLVARARPGTGTEDAGWSRVVVLEPETWTGKDLPIASRLDEPGPVAAGRWRLVLYRHDCPHCRFELPRLIEEHQQDPSHGRKLSLVELPPYASAVDSPIPPHTRAKRLRLGEERSWFCATPAVIDVDNGRVVAARTIGDPELRRLARSGECADWPTCAATDRTIDLGYVEPGALLRTRVVLDGVLARRGFDRLQSACACMEAVPLKAGSLALVFKAPKKPVDYDQALLAVPAGGGKPTLLRVQAGVGRPLGIAPARLKLAVGETATIRVRNRLDTPVRILFVTASSSAVAARAAEPVIAPQSEGIVRVISRAAGTGSITVTTDLEVEASLIVTFHCEP